ncbi:hypothetical protein GCM10027200_13970 [Lentzea nigeriaca]
MANGESRGTPQTAMRSEPAGAIPHWEAVISGTRTHKRNHACKRQSQSSRSGDEMTRLVKACATTLEGDPPAMATPQLEPAPANPNRTPIPDRCLHPDSA